MTIEPPRGWRGPGPSGSSDVPDGPRESGTAPVAALALDVGGSAIKSGVVLAGGALWGAPERDEIDSQAPAPTVLARFAQVLARLRERAVSHAVVGIGVAMPGPFDYERGVSRMRGLGKFDRIYGLSLAEELATRVPGIANLHWRWINDASAFALGELRYGAARGVPRVMFLTLGTGCGSAFAVDGKLVASGPGVPPDGYVYTLEHRGRRIDELLSQRGVMRIWRDLATVSGEGRLAGRASASAGGGEAHSAGHAFVPDGGREPQAGSRAEPVDAETVAALAQTGNERAKETYRRFGELLATALAPVTTAFRPDLVVLGGQISRSFDLFTDAAREAGAPPLTVADELESAALKGAASLVLEEPGPS